MLFFVATALLSVGDGVIRSFKFVSLRLNAYRKGFKLRTQYDVSEALAAYGVRLEFLAQDGPDGSLYRLGYDTTNSLKNTNSNNSLYVQGPFNCHLPMFLYEQKFVLGVKFDDNIINISARTEYYILTTIPEQACSGIYLPTNKSHYEQ